MCLFNFMFNSSGFFQVPDQPCLRSKYFVFQTRGESKWKNKGFCTDRGRPRGPHLRTAAAGTWLQKCHILYVVKFTEL